MILELQGVLKFKKIKRLEFFNMIVPKTVVVGFDFIGS